MPNPKDGVIFGHVDRFRHQHNAAMRIVSKQAVAAEVQKPSDISQFKQQMMAVCKTAAAICYLR